MAGQIFPQMFCVGGSASVYMVECVLDLFPPSLPPILQLKALAYREAHRKEARPSGCLARSTCYRQDVLCQIMCLCAQRQSCCVSFYFTPSYRAAMTLLTIEKGGESLVPLLSNVTACRQE